MEPFSDGGSLTLLPLNVTCWTLHVEATDFFKPTVVTSHTKIFPLSFLFANVPLRVQQDINIAVELYTKICEINVSCLSINDFVRLFRFPAAKG